MARIQVGRLTRRMSGSALAALAILAALLAGPVTAAAAATVSTAATDSAQTAPSGSIATALTQAFESAQHIPGSAVGGIRAGSEHVGTASGAEWALATFTPSARAGQQLAARFQDGAATGVFTERAGGTWRLVRTGPYGCGAGLPATLAGDWGLARPASCSATAATIAAQRTSAQRALAAVHASTAATSLGQSIANIALSQVGVSDTPAVTNFNGVDCDPYSTLVAGFSADSDGCGYNANFGVENENETWCSDFNKWVWEQAGVTVDMNTLNAGAVSFYDWAVDQGQTPQIDTGTPQVGDSVVFFSPGNFPDFADHVGIVTSVSSNGTIDMVNGDFAATPDVHVEYDTGITSLTSFGESVEGPGEQWVIVAPPTTAQQPVPAGHLSGPTVAVAGSTGAFHASGTVPGGSVTGYYWTFGDGRTTNASGPDVTHEFSEAGTYTVSVTITSSFGTIVTLTRNVRVLAPSSSVASVPYDGIWYDPLPILQYVFTRSAGGLAVDSWDGGSWLQLAVPGDPSATGNLTALSYPDAANADAMTPHAYYRAADGSLAETYLAASGWVTQDLPGSPVAGGAIAATTTASGYPAVFFADAGKRLAESFQTPSGWATKTLTGAAPVADSGSLVLADTVAGPRIFAVGSGGRLTVTSVSGPVWVTRAIPAAAKPGSSLAALTTPSGAAAVFFTSRSGALAEATEGSGAAWRIAALPGTPDPRGGLAATTYLLPSVIPATPGDFANPPGSLTDSSAAEPLGTEAFYLTASGAPGVTYDSGSSWQTATLPAVSGATAIAGATAYQVEEEPSNVFLAGDGLTEETTGARSGDPSGGTWTSLTLPDTPATWADRVVLYAADPADAAAAQAAAAAAGLPASQVITSFAIAWADTLSGEYLVLAVGDPAVAALYFNVCGWANPSALPAESTPFSYDLGPLNTLPGADTFVNAEGATAADTQALATDLAYYALNGTLPAGVTSLPAAAAPQYACSGSPS
jgi:hypothetical protein